MKNLGNTAEKPHAAFDFPEEKHAGVGRDFAARKVDFELFSLKVFKKKAFGGMMKSTKDTATHFFIDFLPKGTYVFEYPLKVVHRGAYQNGLAFIECMYAPEFNSHSESFKLEVK